MTTENTLRISLENVLQQMPDAILIVNSGMDTIFVNKQFESMFGYSASEILNTNFSKLLPEMTVDAHAHHVSGFFKDPKVRNMGEGRRLEARRSDGSLFPVEISLSPIETKTGMLVMSTIRDISARMEDKQALIQAREDALSAAKTKADFLAKMSHEIRTPLNVIIGLSDLLEDTTLNTTQVEYVTTLRRAGVSLLDIINDILDISKLDAGHMELNAIPFSLRSFVHESIDVYIDQAREKGLDVNVSIAASVPDIVHGDPGFLRQVLVNVLSNAIKFTENGHITIDVSQGQEQDILIFNISDSGRGIPEQEFTRIFDSFTQVKHAFTSSPGTGLGLSIANELINMMGGTISVTSQPRQGSTFTLTLPLPSHQGPVPSDNQLSVTNERTHQKCLRILLAEDSEDNILVFKTYLLNAGHSVDVAINGQEAVSMYHTNSYDLILMDLQMPVMDGFEAVSIIRHQEVSHGLTPTPILAISAFTHEEEKEKSRRAGCNEHLTKPMRKRELLNAIQRYAPLHSDDDSDVQSQSNSPDSDLDELVPGYLKNRSREIPKLETALAQSDFDTIATIGHKLKGHGGSYGFPELSKIGKELEKQAKAKSAEDIKILIHTYRQKLAEIPNSEAS